MSLEQGKILKNTEKYFKTGEKFGFMNEELMNFLGQDFIKAPASTMKSLHNAFEGGLIDHTLRVTSYAVKLNDVLPENMKVSVDSLIKVSCLHQIGKAKLYKENTSQWHKDNQGKMYEFNDRMVSMSVGERSAHYALSYGIKLSEEEFQAIVNFAKDSSDKQAKYHSNTLAVLLRQAIELAIMEEQFNNNIVEVKE